MDVKPSPCGCGPDISRQRTSRLRTPAMPNLLSSTTRDCQRTSRRSFLEIGTLAGIGLSLPMALAARRQALAAGKGASDINCIMVWAQGGTSHHDTFDPKPNAPVSVKGEFNVI